jgi:type I restriction enzyme S subunit
MWPTVKLGEVLRQEREQVGTFDGNGLPVLGVTNIDGVTQTGVAASEDKSKYLRLRPGRFVYNPYRINVGSIGLSSDLQDGICSPAYVVFAPTEQVITHFIWFFLKSARGNQLINFYGNRGSVRSALRFDDLCQIEVPLPPLSEQRRIVARIEKLAAQIQEARELRRQVEEEAEALLRSLLTRATSIIPTPMRQLVHLRQPDVVVDRDAVYQFAGVYSFGRGVFKGDRKSGMDFAYPRLTRLRAGEFVYPKLMAWEGALGIVPFECDGCVVSPEFPVFIVNKNYVLPEVLDVYFRTPSVWPMLAGESTGTNVRRRRLNPKDFLDYAFPLPAMETQLLFRNVQAEVDALKRLQAESATELDALLPAVLDRAFKGEL